MSPLSESKHFLKNAEVLYWHYKLGVKGQDYKFLDLSCYSEKKNSAVFISVFMSEVYMAGKDVVRF